MSNEPEIRITRDTALAMAADQLLLLKANSELGEKIVALGALSQAWFALAAVMQPDETIIASKGSKIQITRQM